MKLSDRIEQMVQPGTSLQEIDQVLNHWLSPRGSSQQRVWRPRTNIVERDKDFVVSMELPGVNVDDVNVEASDESLIISGEKAVGSLNENEKMHRSERIVGQFERSFEFNTLVDFDGIEAHFDAGVLTVTVPKSEKVLPRKIKVQTAK